MEGELSWIYVGFTSVQFAHLAFPINFVQPLFFFTKKEKSHLSYHCIPVLIFPSFIKKSFGASYTVYIYFYNTKFIVCIGVEIFTSKDYGKKEEKCAIGKTTHIFSIFQIDKNLFYDTWQFGENMCW